MSDLKILEEKDNSLLNRKEVKIIVEAGKTPSYEEAGNLLQEKYKTDKENIIVKSIKGKFGRKTFLISAFIYKTKEDKEKFEPKKKKEEKAEEKQAAAEQKTEKKEKPAEEKKKEDKAAEEKQEGK